MPKRPPDTKQNHSSTVKHLSGGTCSTLALSLLVLALLLGLLCSKSLLLLGINNIVIIRPFGVILGNEGQSHALPKASLLAELDVTDA